MPKYHVHVYQICGMCEIDIEAKDSTEARNKAMEDAVEKQWMMGFPDIKQIALTFDDEEGQGG
jgi:hypothetical protein